jgi:hypothetical protein
MFELDVVPQSLYEHIALQKSFCTGEKLGAVHEGKNIG